MAGAVPHTLSTGQEISLRPVPDLAAFRAALPPLAGVAGAAGDEAALLRTVQDHLPAMVALVEQSAGQPPGWADALPLEDFFGVLAAVLRINAAALAAQGLRPMIDAIREAGGERGAG